MSNKNHNGICWLSSTGVKTVTSGTCQHFQGGCHRDSVMPESALSSHLKELERQTIHNKELVPILLAGILLLKVNF